MNTKDFQKNYDMLNPEQKDAVDTLYGPIMVVAGPGTGKTQIIALRAANIILKAGLNPENIFITTFTEAGVVAIRQRLLDFIGEDAYKVQVSTIHWFSQEVIQTFPEKFIAYKAGVSIDDVDQMEILRNILEKEIQNGSITALTSDYDPLYYLRDIKSRISTLKQEWVTPDRLSILTKKQVGIYEEELAEIKPTLKKYETTKEKQAKHIEKLTELEYLYRAYNQYLRDHSRYDFNDMIQFVVQEFRQDEELRLHYAELFQFIMLDEYQDTNNSQNEIIQLILSEDPSSFSGDDSSSGNIMVVGDDDQSIYRFQGANIENMLDFYQVYPDTKFIVLRNNYRSNQQILDTAKTLIEHNDTRLTNSIKTLEKELISAGKYANSQEIPTLYRAQNETDEDAYIYDHITRELALGTPIEEIAIIVRNNKEVKKWSTLLSQNGIESESKLQSNILQSHYVSFILDFLMIVQNPHANDTNFIHILRSSILKLSQIDILRINRYLYIENYRRKVPLKMIDVLIDDQKLQIIWDLDISGMRDFRERFLSYRTKIQEMSLREFLSFLIEDIELLEHIHKQGSFDDTQDVYTLLATIKNWSENSRDFSVDDLLSRIALYREYNYPIQRQILKKPKKWVQIVTAHSSKWLEYEVVFIPGLYTGNWDGKKIPDKLKLPNSIAGEWIQELAENAIEEERRLFFVAVTRSKNKLFLSFPAGRDKKPLLPSIFLEEIVGVYSEIDDYKSSGILEEMVETDISNKLIHYSGVEFDYISEFLENYRLSPSDLNTFLSSPIEFLNRVVFRYPFSGNKFTAFGTVYHRTLELFYLKYKQEAIIPEKSYLTTTFLHLIKKELLTSSELEEATEKGIQGLEWYYDLYSSQMSEPFLLEYSFRRKNIFFEWIPLTGTIDKVEKLGETASQIWNNSADTAWQMAFFKDTVKLIDYKTGKTKTENTIKWLDRYGNKKQWEWKYFRQLLFYKLLSENDREFMEKFSIGGLAIDFVEWKDGKYKQVEIQPTQEEYNEFLEEIKTARAQISDIEFWKEILTK